MFGRRLAVGAARREVGRQVAARRAAVAERDGRRHRAHDAAAALLLLPRMGEDAYRAREHEEAATELGLEAQLAEDRRP